MHLLPPSQYIFPNPEESDFEGEGLICIGADLSPSTLYEAYTHGLFPWFSEGDPICWPRAYADETWISEEIIQGYCDLFDAGYGYSIEVWDEDRVVGGLYGVTIGKGCFGESMFSTQTDVSKMAFYTLMLIGRENQLPWIDCQLVNDHLMSLGACTISRHTYLKSLQDVIKQPAINWKKYQDGVFSSKTIAQSARLSE